MIYTQDLARERGVRDAEKASSHRNRICCPFKTPYLAAEWLEGVASYHGSKFKAQAQHA